MTGTTGRGDLKTPYLDAGGGLPDRQMNSDQQRRFSAAADAFPGGTANRRQVKRPRVLARLSASPLRARRADAKRATVCLECGSSKLFFFLIFACVVLCWFVDRFSLCKVRCTRLTWTSAKTSVTLSLVFSRSATRQQSSTKGEGALTFETQRKKRKKKSLSLVVVISFFLRDSHQNGALSPSRRCFTHHRCFLLRGPAS